MEIHILNTPPTHTPSSHSHAHTHTQADSKDLALVKISQRSLALFRTGVSLWGTRDVRLSYFEKVRSRLGCAALVWAGCPIA
jgi:hypothetical protein